MLSDYCHIHLVTLYVLYTPYRDASDSPRLSGSPIRASLLHEAQRERSRLAIDSPIQQGRHAICPVRPPFPLKGRKRTVRGTSRTLFGTNWKRSDANGARSPNGAARAHESGRGQAATSATTASRRGAPIGVTLRRPRPSSSMKPSSTRLCTLCGSIGRPLNAS